MGVSRLVGQGDIGNEKTATFVRQSKGYDTLVKVVPCGDYQCDALEMPPTR